MPSYSKNETVLVRYPFSNLTSTKVRPAVIVNAPHPSQDVLDQRSRKGTFPLPYCLVLPFLLFRPYR